MESVWNLIANNSHHIVNLSLIIALGLIGAFANAFSAKNFKNGFYAGSIVLSVFFVSPTVYILLEGLVDYKFQILFTILSGAFHEDAFVLLRGRFNKSGQIINGRQIRDNDKEKKDEKDERKKNGVDVNS